MSDPAAMYELAPIIMAAEVPRVVPSLSGKLPRKYSKHVVCRNCAWLSKWFWDTKPGS